MLIIINQRFITTVCAYYYTSDFQKWIADINSVINN